MQRSLAGAIGCLALVACGGSETRADEANTGAGTGGLASGTYLCTGYVGSTWTTLGALEIDGDQYRGIAQQPLEGSFATYSVAGDAIEWSVGLGDFEDNVGAVIGTTLSGAGIIEIVYTTPAGASEGLECARE